MSDLIERAERAIALRLSPPVHELIARIRELEARVELLKNDLEETASKHTADYRRAEKAEAERDTIEAATRERCAQTCESWEEPHMARIIRALADKTKDLTSD